MSTPRPMSPKKPNVFVCTGLDLAADKLAIIEKLINLLEGSELKEIKLELSFPPGVNEKIKTELYEFNSSITRVLSTTQVKKKLEYLKSEEKKIGFANKVANAPQAKLPEVGKLNNNAAQAEAKKSKESEVELDAETKGEKASEFQLKAQRKKEMEAEKIRAAKELALIPLRASLAKCQSELKVLDTQYENIMQEIYDKTNNKTRGKRLEELNLEIRQMIAQEAPPSYFDDVHIGFKNHLSDDEMLIKIQKEITQLNNETTSLSGQLNASTSEHLSSIASPEVKSEKQKINTRIDEILDIIKAFTSLLALYIEKKYLEETPSKIGKNILDLEAEVKNLNHQIEIINSRNIYPLERDLKEEQKIFEMIYNALYAGQNLQFLRSDDLAQFKKQEGQLSGKAFFEKIKLHSSQKGKGGRAAKALELFDHFRAESDQNSSSLTDYLSQERGSVSLFNQIHRWSYEHSTWAKTKNPESDHKLDNIKAADAGTRTGRIREILVKALPDLANIMMPTPGNMPFLKP